MKDKIKILFVSAEVVPFSKTGGLADVAYALPRSLIEQGVDIRIMTTKSFHNKVVPVLDTHIISTEVEVGWRKQFLGISEAIYNNIPYYFIDNEYYFKRENLYGYFDDGERYSYFCRAVLESIVKLDFAPDIIHFNDWHTAMIPLLMNTHYRHIDKFKNIKTVFTIHNLKYQGVFERGIMKEVLNLDDSEFNSGAIEFYGKVNFMKSGITFSDVITTVSSTYASEIREAYLGENLHKLIEENNSKLFGIVNGIDFELYNPENDKKIFENYSYKNSSVKAANKSFLQEKLSLPMVKNKPLIGMITRLTGQKGIDLLDHIIEEMLDLDVQLVILGTGEEEYEKMLKHFSYEYPNNLSIIIKFDENLAHQIYAGADMFLMPSKFEPCGLSQMISQRYGTVPIVRETGGLKDTVEPYNIYTDMGTGFSFGSYNAHEMLFAVKRAVDLYSDKKKWRTLVKRIMKIDSSWTKSAKVYKGLYENLIRGGK